MNEFTGSILLSHLFQMPAAAEGISAGFDRPPNVKYLTLRFPRIVKIHNDKPVDEVMSSEEYQRLAQSSLNASRVAGYGSLLCKLEFDSFTI